MCTFLVCHFIAFKHFSVLLEKIQREHQTNYPHSRSQHLDSWTLLRGCFQKAVFSPVLLSNVLCSSGIAYLTIVMQTKKGCGGH